MQRSPVRTFWTLAAVGAATAVGVLTQEPGFIVITFVGTLIVPRMLGIAGPKHGHGWDHHRQGWRNAEARLDEWHSRAHAESVTAPRSDAPASA